MKLPAKILVVSGWFPPRPGAASMVMRNVLEWVDPACYLVASEVPPPNEPTTSAIPGVRVVPVLRSARVNQRGQQLWSTAQIPLAAARIAALARREKCALIYGIYPDLPLMAAAYLAHRISGLPLAAYMHDFMIEAGYTGYVGAICRWLQPRLFREAHPMWTMSDGMTEYIVQHYGITTTAPLIHAYNQPIPSEPPASIVAGPTNGVQAFFSGAVYHLNGASLGRIASAIRRIPGARLTISGANNERMLQHYKISGPAVESRFIPDHRAYLDFMRGQDVLICSLAWPDESSFGRNELATIFSTKLPEYLAQGLPILVHCPADYFLARFIRDNDCGWVVGERSEEALTVALREIQQDAPARLRRCRNALATARRFSGEKVARYFCKEISDVINHGRVK